MIDFSKFLSSASEAGSCLADVMRDEILSLFGRELDSRMKDECGGGIVIPAGVSDIFPDALQVAGCSCSVVLRKAAGDSAEPEFVFVTESSGVVRWNVVPGKSLDVKVLVELWMGMHPDEEGASDGDDEVSSGEKEPAMESAPSDVSGKVVVPDGKVHVPIEPDESVFG